MKVFMKSRRLIGMSLVIAMFMAMLSQINISVTHATLAIEGKDNTPMPTGMLKPAKNVPYTDPTYGTSITRVTNAAADGVGTFAINNYSRIQSFNSDNTKILIYGSVENHWHIYNAAAPYNMITTLPFSFGVADTEPQWHPTNPNILYYLGDWGLDRKLYSIDVTANPITPTVVADFVPLIANGTLPWPTCAGVTTKTEGSPSADGRYWAFVCSDASWNKLGYFTWDNQTKTVIATITSTAANGLGAADHVSMSPSGNNVVISVHNSAGTTGAVQYTRNLQFVRKLADSGEHSDIALLPNGNDAYVSIDYENGEVYFVDMGTGVKTVLFNIWEVSGADTAIHFSGKAYNKPGWVLVSTYQHGSPVQWFNDKVFALELTANPRIYPLAHNHVAQMPQSQTYWMAPKAVPNRDFTKVLFNTNWEVVDELAADTYMINLSASDIPPAGGGTPTPTSVIVDNADATGVTKVGTWTTSTFDTARYGADYLHDGGTHSVTFTPTLPSAGTYSVYMMWPAGSNRASNVPVDILHAGVTSTVTVNQTTGGNQQWNLLGTYTFSAGTGGNVKIRTTATNGYVMADAVKFVKDTSVSVIVDNAASSGVTKVGTWTTSTFDTNRYGADYLHNGGIKSVTFTPTLPSAGTYSVYMMWPAGSNRATNAPVDILHAGVTSTVTVNQTTGGNQQWNLLGTYTFSAGTGGNVKISNSGANGYVMADAVKFVKQ
ncbi:hypothetical protein ACFPPD_21015 [Cohnella suwonensis]|uniref:Golvesin/Xly CBD-like domain-containing protein n=1 Tax=Cohnella suwonensis TaxID=696072 RepID=A0ABW0M1X2_9BACL